MEANTQKFYSSTAGVYDLGLWLNGYKRAADHIVGRLPFKASAPLKVLDAGCGTGLYSLAILKKFPEAQVHAFDFNEGMLGELRKNLRKSSFENRTSVFIADALGDLPYEEEGFDLIVTGGLMEYVNIKEAVLNLARYLRRDGYFLNSPVRDNFLGSLVAKWAGFELYKTEENLSAFTRNGFRFGKFIEIPFRHFPICLVKDAHLFIKKRGV